MNERMTAMHDELVDLLPSLRAYARSLTSNSVDADDLVQDTLMKAIASIRQFTPGTSLRAWLFTIERNCFYTAYHKRVREPIMAVDELPGIQAAASQEWTVALNEVDRALGKLSSEQREALMLVGGNGLTYEEAAEICNCALGTIKSRVNRARETLLHILKIKNDADFLPSTAVLMIVGRERASASAAADH
ncbi:sigma-70 family RNA polymerase sigma factor [Thalassobaculum sp.]|uniref:sigma-70 family RNA polymerase sigma factor n=1 Tax=Thalassobaculum sp. TaxID=2022740 RepID=UPI0032EFB575